ncbi:hypothetical protein BU26DRAFT_237967 [Trematosphaeria pertusa]|uniref:Uncharacterized protein n=1 Tax=Trematosphaeria pertusa TaxID=390896 RepID=A0A6A6HQP2_9PLEO|nr:uncharacterized protein BU26DRAFT_237967 [Trematosphaeria pertusa]KAF2240341.1 hypothetical protein BU26DRAFT_237967 [Trematosphaeria pertusa]
MINLCQYSSFCVNFLEDAFSSCNSARLSKSLLCHGNDRNRSGLALHPLTSPPCTVSGSTCSQAFAMAVGGHIESVNWANCPKCGYNNITGRETCEGTLADGSTCGAALPIAPA